MQFYSINIVCRDQTHTYHRPPTSSKYSLVRNTQSKGQSCATSNAKRQVLSHDSLTERKATTSRTVLPPGSATNLCSFTLNLCSRWLIIRVSQWHSCYESLMLMASPKLSMQSTEKSA